MRLETPKKNEKNTKKFTCEYCDYICSTSFLWNQHLGTKKHQKKTKNMLGNATPQLHVCEICNNSYRTRGGLWKHKRKNCCLLEKTPIFEEKPKIVENSELFQNSNMSDMLMTVMKDNEKLHNLLIEQQKQMGNMIPQMGNNNNNKFNLNFFLNEQCKNAINLQDFIVSLNVQLEDLEYTKNNGISKGITHVLMNGLKQLDVYNRPIHCTDPKRTTMYVKDKNEWERDQEHEKIKESITVINKKHITAIKEWEAEHPNWEKNDFMTQEYMRMVQSVTNQNDQTENLIIKQVAKEVTVDKDNDKE